MSRLISTKTIIFYIGTVFLSSTAVYAEELVKRTQVMMGTYVSVSLPQDKIELSNQAFGRIKEVELALSSYDVNAEIYKLNHSSNTSLSLDSYESLALSQKYYKQTDGYFDITIGSITKGLFHFGEEESIPNTQDLKKVIVDFKGLHFSKESAWIEEGIVVDLGGMGKGFAVDKAKEVLSSVDKAVIALSGDIYCISECLMAVQNPFNEEVLASFKMKDRAISTSGNYRRYVKDRAYNHLVNPKKRQSQKTFASITLVSSSYSNADLDAYATAASVMPYNKSLMFLKKMGLPYLLVTNEKKVLLSREFKNEVKEFRFFWNVKIQETEYIKALPLKFQKSKKIKF